MSLSSRNLICFIWTLFSFKCSKNGIGNMYSRFSIRSISSLRLGPQMKFSPSFLTWEKPELLTSSYSVLPLGLQSSLDLCLVSIMQFYLWRIHWKYLQSLAHQWLWYHWHLVSMYYLYWDWLRHLRCSKLHCHLWHPQFCIYS